MAKNIYEYIGKKELFRRAQNVSYIELPKIKDLVYSKYEGCEWLENEKITIRSQACGHGYLYRIVENMKKKFCVGTMEKEISLDIM